MGRKLKIFFVPLLLLFFSLPSSLYADLADIIVDHSPASVSSPKIAADGNGHVYVVWEDNRNGTSDIYFNYSSDYGLTYQSSDIRLDTDTPGASNSNSPQIACDNSGHVYVVWEDERTGSSEIYFNYSQDYGVTWLSTDIKLNTDPYAPPAHSPKITCDNSGQFVYVAWDDNYFNVSNNFGTSDSWLQKAVRISNSGGVDTQLACDQNNHVYVAWRTSNIFFNYSDNNGVDWQNTDIKISDDNATPYGLSLVSNESGKVYFTWHDGRISSDNPDVYFNSYSVIDNMREGPDVKINANGPAIWPKVTYDNTGHVYVTWYDRRNGLGDIYLNFSSDYGTNWQISDIRLDTGAVDSGYPEIASDNNGHIYVIWSDDQASIGGPGLYLNYSLDYGTTWLSENMKIGSSGLNPQIVTDANSSYIVKDNNDILFNYITPFVPIEPTPINGATQISITPTLSWRGGNLNLDDTLTYDVYFDISSPPTTLVSPNQPGRTYAPETLAYSTTYYWKIVSRDSSGTETAGPIWSFKTISNPPQFVDFSPPDGVTGVGLTPTLSWTATDPNPGDTITYDVYFGIANPPPIKTTNQVSNIYNPGLLSHYTTYYWKIVARDNNGSEAEGPVLSFTTLNNPPQFTGYLPSDGAAGVSLTPTLSWFASDPDPDDTLTYDIYFGNSSPPSLILSNQTITTYQPGQLNHLTAYYWKIVARDNHGAVTETPILSFTTLNNPPQFLSFSPGNGSMGNSLTPTLSWSASDPDPDDTLTYDIYFGTSSSPPLVLSNQTATTYQPGQLSYSTRYYWKIVARDNHGAETSILNYFFTMSAAPQFTSFYPVDGATGISLTPTLSWTATDEDPNETLYYDIYFGTSSSPPLVLSYKTTTTYQPQGTLYIMTTYYWKIVARDSHNLKTVGPVISFTTGSRAPKIQSFTPANNSTKVSTTPTLSWTATDDDPGDIITFDVYFGTPSDPPLVVARQSTRTYNPEELLSFTKYYWKIVARDKYGTETIGPILSFTTGSRPPVFLSFTPADSAADVSPTPTLQWSASDPDGDTLTFDVYFGTSSPPPKVVTNQKGYKYNPGELIPMTVYRWKIVARDIYGTETVGPILYFITGNPPHINSISPNPCQTLKIISIKGVRFGATQGDSEIHLGAKVFGPGTTRIRMWSDTRIDFKVPAYTGWPSGTTRTIKLWVKVKGMVSNKVQLTITKP